MGRFRNLVFGVLVSCAGYSEARAGAIINGDFSTGDLTGWQASALNDDNQAIAPPVGVEILPQGNVAAVATVPYAGSATYLPITELSQAFTASADPLVFDIGFTTTPDPNEPNDHLFHDSLAVLLSDGTNTYTLLAVDGTGLMLNPFGDAPGTIFRTASDHPSLTDHVEFQPNLAGLASTEVTLSFDLLNQADGYASIARVGDVAVVPEPNCGALALVLSALWSFRRRRYG